MENISRTEYGTTSSGETVYLYTLTNPNGLKAKIINYGAILTELWVPDRNNQLDDIVLGRENLEKYIEKNAQFGTIVGRYGNRIAQGKFTLDGKEYQLKINNGPNHLHGGLVGFDKKVWNSEIIRDEKGPGVRLHYKSRDGEEGYPGTLDVSITYILTEKNELILVYKATSDQPTVLNLTHHSYFNLKGHGNGDILDHELTLYAEKYLPTDSTNIPYGPEASVEGTPLDFRQPHLIGERIETDHEQIRHGYGYDHSFLVKGTMGELRPAAMVTEKITGRVMEVLTTEPAIQIYTGNHLDGTLTGKNGKIYFRRFGICLEAQHYPDSPNHPDYPTTVLRPGDTYRQTTVYKFSVKD